MYLISVAWRVATILKNLFQGTISDATRTPFLDSPFAVLDSFMVCSNNNQKYNLNFKIFNDNPTMSEACGHLKLALVRKIAFFFKRFSQVQLVCKDHIPKYKKRQSSGNFLGLLIFQSGVFTVETFHCGDFSLVWLYTIDIADLRDCWLAKIINSETVH